MKVSTLQPGDTVWIYNDTIKLYLELKIVEHNEDNTTTCAITGKSELQAPEDGDVISSVYLEQNSDVDKVTDFRVVKTPRLRRLILKIKSFLRK